MPRGERYTDAQKETARRLRGEGYTYREIIDALGGGIPKNTISGWVRDIELTDDQVARIEQIQLDARAVGRPLAAEWHREQKRQRLEAAQTWAQERIPHLIMSEEALLMLLAMLWAGEGAKQDGVLNMGNSSPRLIKAWLISLRTLFAIEESKFRVQLVISEGMPEEELRLFWSIVTNIPLSQFQKTFIDMRPKTKRRAGYKGVCKVLYMSAELHRKIQALAYEVFDSLVEIENENSF